MSFDWHRKLAAALALIVWLCLPTIGSRVAAAESDFLAGRSKACPNCALQNAPLKRKDLTGADLSGANLSGTVLHRARLARAKLTGTNLTNANLNKTDLKNASLVRAKLSGAMLYETDASAADFTERRPRGQQNGTGAPGAGNIERRALQECGFDRRPPR